MSKIDEMAKEYCQGSSFDDACMMKPAYIAGANAVLKEIEKAMDLGEPPYLISTEQAYYQVIQKIKELKGK